MTRRLIIRLLQLILLVSTIILITICDTSKPILHIVLICVPQVLLILSYIFDWLNHGVLSKLFKTSFVISCVIIITYIVMIRLGIFDKFSSVSALRQYIISSGNLGIFVYITIQLLQVVFLPIPASIICIVGSLIYGPVLGGLYCSIGVVLGSIISYIIGNVFGFKLVSYIIGKDKAIKYSDILRKRGVLFLAIAFLLPMFPDDILCFVAGVTKIPIKKFLLVTLITRPIGVICMSIFGSGYLIPFSGWGIYVWMGILVVAVAIMLIMFKWQDKMQDWIISKVFRKKTLKSSEINQRTT
ncbi:MAG: TVP38/TMEM64 family protein [Clostridiales bacterium]|nr:TVP38/TMEM64 family protein [Clostridiales bacterium]